jgi:hypothetical protein
VAQQPVTEQQLIGYLLGILPESEAAHFDELSVTDDEFVERLDAAENDLVDAYAAGTLSGEQVRRFESYYLASARRRDKARFAKAFLENPGTVAATVEPVRATSAGPMQGRSLRARLGFGAPKLAWGLSAAAFAVLLLASYLAYYSVRLQQRVQEGQSERAALAQREQDLLQQLEAQRSATEETRRELENVRESLQALEEKPPDVRTGGEGGGLASETIALTLAVPMRGAGRPPTVSIPSGARTLALTLRLDPADFAAYDASLKDAATGRIIWHKEKLYAKSRPGKTLVTRIPAALLKAQTYSVDLTGVSADGTSELLGSYSFTVIKPQ